MGSILTSLSAEELREKADTMAGIAAHITRCEQTGEPSHFHRPAAYYTAIADDCRAAAQGIEDQDKAAAADKVEYTYCVTTNNSYYAGGIMVPAFTPEGGVQALVTQLMADRHVTPGETILVVKVYPPRADDPGYGASDDAARRFRATF